MGRNYLRIELVVFFGDNRQIEPGHSSSADGGPI